jgi:glycosyltransferase involved in cell wall biosynthesis
VAVVHNPADHDARIWQRLAARRVLGGCRGLFTHASSLAEQLRRAYPGVPVGHHPLPAVGEAVPVDHRAARRKLGLAEDRRVALFIGLIRPYKGVDVLLEAAAGLPEGSDWLVVVAGEPWGKLGAELEQHAASRGLEGRVRLDLGWVPEDRLADLMDAADLLVLPYRRGSQSAVAPMGLARGVPVLATDVGGVPEVVKDGVNGVIVPPSDAAAITRALATLDRERLAGLAEGARRSASMLRWPGYATAFEELLARVI